MSSALRTVLRSRLTTAMRERDRAAASVLRTAVAAIENAEALPVDDGRTVATSADVAGAAVGLGVTEAERRRLDDATERSLVAAEVRSLVEAGAAYASAGDRERARDAAAGVALLRAVLDESGGAGD
ncbi:hypothetical protein ASH01_14690 [Terrabacter sp. Soil811]|uniref:hypothetical protein n=1 Tax=Terrabacter sp. Soil811 TaxID=1736419 RepID=UPI0006F28A6D|nr:hypothetical protein [Terrabacter sp. Soil811]KRF43067.1 hypothetical protein ASH01_14690 [Terrabacter sp. Soil811]